MTTRSTLLSDDARQCELVPIDLDHTNVISGSPTTSAQALQADPASSKNSWEIGVWEITPGTVADIEVDELFIVLSGRARMEVAGGNSLILSVGSVVRLAAGERTTWIVEETIRKVYVLLPPAIA